MEAYSANVSKPKAFLWSSANSHSAFRNYFYQMQA